MRTPREATVHTKSTPTSSKSTARRGFCWRKCLVAHTGMRRSPTRVGGRRCGSGARLRLPTRASTSWLRRRCGAHCKLPSPLCPSCRRAAFAPFPRPNHTIGAPMDRWGHRTPMLLPRLPPRKLPRPWRELRLTCSVPCALTIRPALRMHSTGRRRCRSSCRTCSASEWDIARAIGGCPCPSFAGWASGVRRSRRSRHTSTLIKARWRSTIRCPSRLATLKAMSWQSALRGRRCGS
mmetsp:Transcript_17971/g.58795  ORF Transcript_17971/g.58795 Transcript_17971/m.58795 type:complete len:236 (-) Transcript_17971:665-1372(-)